MQSLDIKIDTLNNKLNEILEKYNYYDQDFDKYPIKIINNSIANYIPDINFRELKINKKYVDMINSSQTNKFEYLKLKNRYNENKRYVLKLILDDFFTILDKKIYKILDKNFKIFSYFELSDGKENVPDEILNQYELVTYDGMWGGYYESSNADFKNNYEKMDKLMEKHLWKDKYFGIFSYDGNRYYHDVFSYIFENDLASEITEFYGVNNPIIITPDGAYDEPYFQNKFLGGYPEFIPELLLVWAILFGTENYFQK